MILSLSDAQSLKEKTPLHLSEASHLYAGFWEYFISLSLRFYTGGFFHRSCWKILCESEIHVLLRSFWNPLWLFSIEFQGHVHVKLLDSNSLPARYTSPHSWTPLCHLRGLPGHSELLALWCHIWQHHARMSAPYCHLEHFKGNLRSWLVTLSRHGSDSNCTNGELRVCQ